MSKIVLTNEEIEQTIKCCCSFDSEPCNDCPCRKFEEENVVPLCTDVFLQNLKGYFERKTAELNRLQEIVSVGKTECEKLKQDLWVLQEENRELKKDNERLKCYLKEKPNG